MITHSRRSDGEPSTKVDRLLEILDDHQFHSTKELARRVGHTFNGAIFIVRRGNYVVERRKHPTARYQHQYRLPNNRKG